MGIFDKINQKKRVTEIKEVPDQNEILETIFRYSNQGEPERIIEYVNELPAESRTFPVLCQLGCAYNNTCQPKAAIAVLHEAGEEGEGHPVWNYFLGYAYCSLGEKELARQYFFRAREIDSQIPIGSNLFYCTDIPVDIRQNTILQLVSDTLPAHCQIENGAVVVKPWGLTIHVHVNYPSEQQAVAEYTITSPDWEREIFEVCAAIGQTQEHAVFEAQRAFVLGIFQLVKDWYTRPPLQSVPSQLAARRHDWNVYVGDMLTIGDSKRMTAIAYWEMLKDLICSRIGNQKFCYIKIYLSKGNGFAIGECRINNVVSNELSEWLKSVTDSWEGEPFTSHKLFFILEQQKETIQAYPYTIDELEQLTQAAAALFETMHARGGDWYDEYQEELHKIVEDTTLVSSFHKFLPEICAMRAIQNVRIVEPVSFFRQGHKEAYYMSQLSDWTKIEYALEQLICRRQITDGMYQAMLSCSSLFSAYQDGQERNINMENSRSAMAFSIEDYFQIR